MSSTKETQHRLEISSDWLDWIADIERFAVDREIWDYADPYLPLQPPPGAPNNLRKHLSLPPLGAEDNGSSKTARKYLKELGDYIYSGCGDIAKLLIARLPTQYDKLQALQKEFEP